jgi:uncharacterized protein (DUF1501 family)
MHTRRRFLLGTGAFAASLTLPGGLFAGTGAPARLVVVLLRGALDGLTAVPPYGDPHYAGLRGDLTIAAPGAVDGALSLDDTFGLHPSLVFMHERYTAGELLVFNAVASPYRDRSHFDGQNVLENGLSKPLGSADGWLNRALAALPREKTQTAERAVAISQNIPLILRGNAPVISKSPQSTPGVEAELLMRLADLYSDDNWFSARLSDGVQTDKMTKSGAGMLPAASDRVTDVARMAATLMRSEAGPQFAVIEAGGWDTHANQGAAQGVLAQRLAGLDKAMRVLADGLGPLWQNTAVLVVTEFGRTAAINGARGTDHGTGGCAFLVGGAVQGGRVVTDWPGLASSDLLDKRDLKPTLDLRSVFKSVLDEHMRIDSKALANRVFPGSNGAHPLKGLIRA